MQLRKHEVMSSVDIFDGGVRSDVTAMRVQYRQVLDDVYAMDIDAIRDDAAGHAHGGSDGERE